MVHACIRHSLARHQERRRRTNEPPVVGQCQRRRTNEPTTADYLASCCAAHSQPVPEVWRADGVSCERLYKHDASLPHCPALFCILLPDRVHPRGGSKAPCLIQPAAGWQESSSSKHMHFVKGLHSWTSAASTESPLRPSLAPVVW
jgi:hypothetical protein